MINRPISHRARKYATREMLYNESEHAVYGLSYIDNNGELVEKIAETPDQIKYFKSDNLYNEYVSKLTKKYYGVKDFHIYALHRVDFLAPLAQRYE